MTMIGRKRGDVSPATGSQFVDPPDGWGIVTESISRCGMISRSDLNFLARYGFRTVLFISDDNPHQQIDEFLSKQNITWLRIPISSGRGALTWRSQLDELLKQALEFILDSDNYPVLISSSSCLHLCTIIGCLRKMQRWNLCSILEEFRRYTRDQPISMYKSCARCLTSI
jgi:hypothetical protein